MFKRLLFAALLPCVQGCMGEANAHTFPNHRGDMVGASITGAGGAVQYILATGVGTCAGGLGILYDSNGVQACIQVSDLDPTTVVIAGGSAYPGAVTNTGGRNPYITGGWGVTTLTMTAASCGGKTITYAMNSNSAVTGTEGVEFSCSTTNAACATSVAAWIDSLTGVSATANSPTSGKVYATRQTGELQGPSPFVPTMWISFTSNALGTCATIVNGRPAAVDFLPTVTIFGVTQDGVTSETRGLSSLTPTYTLADGTTITNWRHYLFAPPTIAGIAGGGTETVTNAVTVYITGAPSGTNITFTNGPYSLWVDNGTTRLDGTVITGAAVGGTDQVGAVYPGVVAQASLSGTATNGQLVYCNDCTIANPCAGGGTGAMAKRLNGVWVCN